MKKGKTILIILLVIAVITAIAVFLIKRNFKNRQPAPGEDPLGLIGTGGPVETSTGGTIPALTQIQLVKLERYCDEPAKRKYVEDTYKIKCSDYGF